EVANGRGVSHDEFSAAHVRFQHVRHVREILARERHFAGQPLVLRIKRCMAGDAPERLLELGRREKEPLDHLRALLRIDRNQPLVAVLLRQIENNRDGFRENHVTVDEHGKLSSRIDFEECGAAMLAGEQVDGNGLEVDAQFLQRPADADRAGRSKLIELHGVPQLVTQRKMPSRLRSAVTSSSARWSRVLPSSISPASITSGGANTKRSPTTRSSSPWRLAAASTRAPTLSAASKGMRLSPSRISSMPRMRPTPCTSPTSGCALSRPSAACNTAPRRLARPTMSISAY